MVNNESTLFDEISDAYPLMTQTEIRNTLGAFLFSNDDVFKKIGVLSGGEKCRVVLAKIMLSKANFLILDEPTNHLDMTSKTILEDALNAFSGTCLYVSHDRYFINKTADRILSLENGQLVEYLGDYDYYLEKRNQKANVSSESNSVNTAKSAEENDSVSKSDWMEQKKAQSEKRKLENKIKSVEEQIEKLENKLSSIEEEMAKPETSTNSAKLNKLCSEQSEINEKLETLYEEWETLNS